MMNMMNRTWRSLGVLGVAAALCAGAAPAHADGITSEQAQQILDELKAIRKNLEQRPIAPAAAPQAPVRPVDDKVSMPFTPGGFSVGKDDAPLVLVEYTDYQCPFCQRFHNDTYTQIKANYIDTGKLRFVSRDFPLSFHENAMRSAVAGRCAAEQGKYWELRHTLIVNASQLQQDKIMGYAQNASLDVSKFKTCVDSDKYKAAIDKDIAEGTAAGVTGTPSFVLGRVQNGKLEGVRLVGAMPYATFDAKIQELMKAPTAKN
ncbi:MAG: DsbA family protein [Betaproteobacteria bacterium]|nr:MAG: DsbA family protein [Betaproteobacteria bacterium]